MFDSFMASCICFVARLITGVRALGAIDESPRPRIYFANHSSHGDFLLIWAMLPTEVRERTRPVAAADYWLRSKLRRYLIARVFHGELIKRGAHDTDVADFLDTQTGESPVTPPSEATHKRHSPLLGMQQALQIGYSLIFFPEGTRHSDDTLLPFKSGLYHLARSCPEVELVPVWIENIGRAFPKGAVIILPLLCSVHFGAPLSALHPTELKEDFLRRCQDALIALSPGNN